MFLSLNALGSDAVFQTALPPKVQFEDIIFIGECVLDDMHLRNQILTVEEIEAITTQAEWYAFRTVLIANFENRLEAGNLTNSDLPITSWRIYRKKTNELLFKLLIEIPFDPTVSSFVDTTVRNNVEYQYEVRPVSEGTEGNGITGVAVVDFWGWTLSSEDGSTIFKFDMDLNSDSIKTITDLVKIQNYTKFPVVSKGKTKYKEGTLTCMPYEIVNNERDVSLSVLEQLEEFVENNEPKILRNSKGQVWKIATHDFSHKFMDDKGLFVYHITFSWTQIGDVIE